MTNPVLYLEGDPNPLDYIDLSIERDAYPIWSDGRLDGTLVEKIVGYIANRSSREVTLRDGSRIVFSRITNIGDGLFLIEKPYKMIPA